MKRMSFGAFIIALVGSGSVVWAQDSAYSYTDDRSSCFGIDLTSQEGQVHHVQSCDGVPGWAWFSEASEHGQSSRFSDRDDPEVRGQYGGYLGNFGSYHNVIEWRLDDDGEPYATIHRYVSATFDTGDAVRQETLIVSALRPGETPSSCHVGYVDATALAGANELAREMADRLAAGFDCDSETIWVVDAASPTLDAALEAGSTTRAH